MFQLSARLLIGFLFCFLSIFSQQEKYEVEKIAKGSSVVIVNGKYGLQHKKQLVVPAEYSSYTKTKETVWFFTEDSLSSYVHIYRNNGTVLIKDDRVVDVEFMHPLIVGYTNSNQTIIYDQQGKVLVPEGIYEIDLHYFERTFTRFNWDSTALYTVKGEELIPMGQQSIFPADFTSGVYMVVKHNRTHYFFLSDEPLSNGMVKLNQWEFAFNQPVTVGDYCTMIQDVRFNESLYDAANQPISWQRLLPDQLPTAPVEYGVVFDQLQQVLTQEEPVLNYKTEICSGKKQCWPIRLAVPVSGKSNKTMEQPMLGLSLEQQEWYAKWLTLQYQEFCFDEILQAAQFSLRDKNDALTSNGFYLKARFERE